MPTRIVGRTRDQLRTRTVFGFQTERSVSNIRDSPSSTIHKYKLHLVPATANQIKWVDLVNWVVRTNFADSVSSLFRSFLECAEDAEERRRFKATFRLQLGNVDRNDSV